MIVMCVLKMVNLGGFSELGVSARQQTFIQKLCNDHFHEPTTLLLNIFLFT